MRRPETDRDSSGRGEHADGRGGNVLIWQHRVDAKW
jgi:hypothetical protein